MVYIPDMSPGTPGGDYLSKRLGERSGALDKRIAPTETQGPAAPAYDPRVEPNTLMAKQDELEAWQNTPEKSGLGNLGSLESLVKLGLAVAGGLSGNQSLQEAGLGLGVGTILGASEQAQEYNAKRLKQIDSLINQVDTLQGRLMEAQLRNPAGFVDPETGEDMYPAETMQDLLGMNTPFSAAHILANAREGKMDEYQFAIAEKLMNKGVAKEDPAAFMKGLRIVNQIAGMNWSEADMKAISVMDPTQAMVKLNEFAEPASVLAAAKWAADNDVLITSPGALRLLDPLTNQEKGLLGVKIDSMDDLWKAEAWKAYTWFNDTWLNEVDPLTGETNRMKYRDTYDNGMSVAFEHNKQKLGVIKKFFDEAAIPDDMRKIHEKAMFEAFGKIIELNLMQTGALTGGPEALMDAAALYADSTIRLQKGARTVLEQNALPGQIDAFGFNFAQRTGRSEAPPSAQQAWGADIEYTAMALARRDGITDLFTGPVDRKLKYVRMAEDSLDKLLGGEDVKPEVITGPDTVGPPANVLDTTPPPVVVEPVAASAADVKQLANDMDELNSIYDRANALPTNVVKPEGFDAAMQEFEVFRSLPKDQRQQMYDDAAFQNAIGIVRSAAEFGMTIDDVVDMLGDRSKNNKLLDEIRKLEESSPERAAKLARDPKYAAALEWERKMAMVPEATMRKANRKYNRDDAAFTGGY